MLKNLVACLVISAQLIGPRITSAQQQNQQPSSSITGGGGQSIDGPGITQGASTAPPFVSEENLEEYAAACTKERAAEDRWSRFHDAVLDDQNRIRALGFDRTTQQFEEMEANAVHNRETFLLDIAHSLLGGLSNYTRRTEFSMSRSESITWKNIFAHSAPEGEETINSAIDEANATGSDIIHFGQSARQKVYESVDKTWDHYNLTHDPDVIKRALTLAKSLGFGGPYGVLLDPATDVAELAYDEHEANKLTHLTEEQLKQLKNLSYQMKSDADALARSRSELKLAQSVFRGGSCDSTKLVKKEPLDGGSSTATPLPTTPVSAQAPPTGGDDTLWIVGGGLAAAAIAGGAYYYAMNKQNSSGQCDGLSPANACGPCSTGGPNSPQCGGGSCWTSAKPAPFCH